MTTVERMAAAHWLGNEPGEEPILFGSLDRGAQLALAGNMLVALRELRDNPPECGSAECFDMFRDILDDIIAEHEPAR